MYVCLLLVILLGWCDAQYRSPHADSLLYFEMKAIDLEASGSYSLLLRDLDNDGNDDLVLMSYAGTTAGDPPGEVYWYRWTGVNANGTPTWDKRLVSKKKHVVHASFLDVNGDGYEDIVFNSDFEVPPVDQAPEGDFWCVINPGPGSYDQEWSSILIGRVVGNHRTAAADFDGDGVKEAVAIPLFSPGTAPFYGPVEIVLFEPPPATPTFNTTEVWKSSVLSSGQLINPHDVVVVPRPNGQHSLLISAHEGIFRLDITRDGHKGFTGTLVELHGYPVDDPIEDSVARDVGFKPLPRSCDPDPPNLHGVTALPKNVADVQTLPYLATVDYTNTTSSLPGQPWHGDQVSVYFPAEGKTVVDPGLTRKVLEKRYSGGHTAIVYDFDQDGCHDVVAGFREYPTSMMLYRCVKDATALGGVSFRKQILSERGTNDIIVSDFDKDGHMDMATVGFGGMTGVGGDPYVMVWLYRAADTLRISQIDTGDGNDNKVGTYETLVAVLIVLLLVTCAGFGVLMMRARNRMRLWKSEENYTSLTSR